MKTKLLLPVVAGLAVAAPSHAQTSPTFPTHFRDTYLTMTPTAIPHNVRMPGLSGDALSILPADYDLDGDTDLYVVTSLADSFYLNGNSAFADPQGEFFEASSQIQLSPGGTAAGISADVDGDGYEDVVLVGATSMTTGFVSIQRNLGLAQGTIIVGTIRFANGAAQVPTPSNLGPALCVEVVDWNLDGFCDIFVGTATGLHYFQNQPSAPGWFVDRTNIMRGAIPALGAASDVRALSSGDVDGDMRPDLAIGRGSPATAAATNMIMSNTSTAPFVDQTLAWLPFQTAAMTSAIEVVEIGGRSGPELIVGNRSSATTAGGVELHIRGLNSNLPYAAAVSRVEAVGDVRALALGDFSEDGMPDVVAGYYPGVGNGQTVALRSVGVNFAYLPNLIEADGMTSTNCLSLSDMDMDADVDLMIGNAGELSLRYNPSQMRHGDVRRVVCATCAIPQMFDMTVSHHAPFSNSLYTDVYVTTTPPGPRTQLPDKTWLAIDPSTWSSLGLMQVGNSRSTNYQFVIPPSVAGMTFYYQGAVYEFDPVLGVVSFTVTNVMQQSVL